VTDRTVKRYSIATVLIWNGLGWAGCPRWTRYPRHFYV
jgi:hypothetical protein